MDNDCDNVDYLNDGDEVIYQEPRDLTELMNEVSDNAADNAGLTDAEIAAKWRYVGQGEPLI